MNRYIQCLEIRGEKPVVAFAMTAFIIAFSTAVGNVAKDEYDSGGDKTIGGFFLYLVIVFVTAFLGHSMLMFVFSYGGGMLASVKHPLIPSVNFYLTGKKGNEDLIDTIM